MNRGIRYLFIYLGLAWFLAGGGALGPAWDARSNAGEGQKFAVELVMERTKAPLEAAAAEFKALQEADEPDAEALKAITDEINSLSAEREAELEAIKDAAGDEGGGIMALLGPLVAMFLGLGLFAVGMISGGGRDPYADDEEEVKPRARRRKRPREDPAEAQTGGEQGPPL